MMSGFQEQKHVSEFLWKMPGKDDLGTEIAWQYVSYSCIIIGEKKKKENYFFFSVCILLACVMQLRKFVQYYCNLEHEGALKEN